MKKEEMKNEKAIEGAIENEEATVDEANESETKGFFGKVGTGLKNHSKEIIAFAAGLVISYAITKVIGGDSGDVVDEPVMNDDIDIPEPTFVEDVEVTDF